MSKWVYVTGIVRADTFAKTSAEAMYIGQTTINHLPRVWGSEGDANLHVILEDGHNCSSNVDEYDQFSNLYNDPHFKFFDFQTNILITISGQLRDASFDTALRETVSMLCRLSKKVCVSECCVLVRDCFGKEAVIKDKNWWMESLND